jgi:hypothetical protein
MLRIVATNNVHSDGSPVWSVLAQWHGAERCVYSGTVYQCAAYAAALQEMSTDV